MSALSWIVTNWSTIALALTSVIGGASIMVKAIAPFTKNTTDDKAASALDRVAKWLSKIALNPPK